MNNIWVMALAISIALGGLCVMRLNVSEKLLSEQESLTAASRLVLNNCLVDLQDERIATQSQIDQLTLLLDACEEGGANLSCE